MTSSLNFEQMHRSCVCSAIEFSYDSKRTIKTLSNLQLQLSRMKMVEWKQWTEKYLKIQYEMTEFSHCKRKGLQEKDRSMFEEQTAVECRSSNIICSQ